MSGTMAAMKGIPGLLSSNQTLTQGSEQYGNSKRMKALTYSWDQFDGEKKNAVAYTVDIIEANLAKEIMLTREDVEAYFVRNVKSLYGENDPKRAELLQQVCASLDCQ